MGKFLLSLFCLLATAMPAIALETTITIKGLTATLQDNSNVTFAEATLSYSSKKYITKISAGEVFNMIPGIGKNTSNSPSYNKDGSLRLYPNNTLKFVCNEGYKVSKLEFTLAQLSKYSDPTVSTGTGSKVDTKYIWTSDTPVSELTLTAPSTTGKQFCIQDITITYETESVQAPKLEFDAINLTIGSTVPLPVAKGYEDLTYHYFIEANPENIVISDDQLKGVALGEAIVKVTTDPVDGQYLAGEATFKVTVVGKEPKLSFANESVYGKVNTGVVWQQVTVTEPEENLGAITYSSSDPEIVAVDASTGQIKPSDVKKAGVATITATIAANGDYAEGSCSYLIVVVDPNAEAKPGETLFDFTTTNPYGMTTMSENTGLYEKDMANPVTSIAGVNETVIISFDGRYRSWKTSNSNELRVEKSNTTDPASSLTVKVPEGYKITKIGITGSAVNPKYSPESGDSPDDNFNSVWIPAVIDGSSQVVDELTITADPNQLKISKINVMWDASGSDMKPAQLTFAPNVNGIYVNEEAEINAVNNPEGRTITYSIAGLNADQYTITPSEDGKTMKVRVNIPGTYTLEARSAAGDGFRNGFAIMRLNVYRHLMVSADNAPLEKDEVNTGSKTFITIAVPENAYLYYKIENSSAPAPTADDISDNENQLPGYELYEDGIEIPAKTSGTLNFYIANYGYKSPIRKIALSFETGVTDIDANTEDGVVRLFDLNGRQINGEPEKGVYIRIQNGKASKVLVK